MERLISSLAAVAATCLLASAPVRAEAVSDDASTQGAPDRSERLERLQVILEQLQQEIQTLKRQDAQERGTSPAGTDALPGDTRGDTSAPSAGIPDPEDATSSAEPLAPASPVEASETSRSQLYVYPNGDQYVGELQDGVPHGVGTYSASSGRELRGEFRFGRPAGRITTELADGTTISGHYEAGRFSGPVDLTTPAGIRYEGFRLGSSNTYLTIVYPDGRRYEGDVRADADDIMPHGSGILVWPDGRSQRGRFRDGVFVGEHSLRSLNRQEANRIANRGCTRRAARAHRLPA